MSLTRRNERMHVDHAVAVGVRLLRSRERRYVRLPGVSNVDRVGRVPVIADVRSG